MRKRFFALLMALVLVVSCLPTGALAVQTQTPENMEKEIQVPQEQVEQTLEEEATPALSAVHAEHTCEHCADSSVTWMPWDKIDSLPTSGHYYLTEDVSVSAATALVNKELTLCLNGHTITAAARVYRLSNGAKLTVCDCTKGGKIYAGASIGGAFAAFKDANTDAPCTLKVYNITIEGVAGKTPKYGGGVLVNAKDATVLLKGVTFKNLTLNGGTGGETGGAAVYMSEGTASTGSLTMDGCTVTGCVDNSSGTSAAVRVLQVKNVEFKNCSFTDNQNSGTGASAIMLSGTAAKMSGCTVTGNKSTNATSEWVGGVYVYDSATLTLSGKNVITGNTIKNGAAEANLLLQEATKDQNKQFLLFENLSNESQLYITSKRGTTDPNKMWKVNAGDAFAVTYENVGKAYRYDTVQKKFVAQEHIHEAGYADAPAGAAWLPWTKTDSLPTSGYYYLTEDVALTNPMTLNTNGAQLTLCLNGKSVTAPAAGRVFRVSNGHDLTVCDHTKGGTLYAGSANGGAISLVTDTNDAGYCDLKVFDITIEGTAGNVPKQGGGISCTNPHNNATLKNVTFKNLTIAGSALGGSAVNFYSTNSDGKLYVEGCTFTGCTDASNDNCGTVRVWQAASVEFKNCTFKNNTSVGVGASAIILSGAKNAKMSGCTITGNTSTGNTDWAGAVYVFPSSDLTLTGKNDISGNTKNGGKDANLVLVESKKDADFKFLHFADIDPASKLFINARRGTTDPNKMMDASGDTFTIDFDGGAYYYDTTLDKFVMGHKHDDEYAGVDGSVEWKPWTKTNELPDNDDPGHWYLTENVTLDDERFAEIKTAEVYVCLNGFTVTAKAKGSDNLGTNVWRLTGAGSLTVCDCSAKTVSGVYTAGKLTGACMGAIYTLGNVGATINFYDGIICGNWTEGANSGAAICIQTGSTLNLRGGLLTDNEASTNGGAIYNSGAVNIYGGEISGNTAAKIAGGIYTVSNCYIYGGKITGNIGGDTAGGVFSGGGVMGISGTPEITGNKLGSADNNLYLATGKIITLGEMGEGTAKIGVSVASSTLPRTVSNDMGAKDRSAYFFSDNTEYEIINKDNKLHIQTLYKHLHDHQYAGVDGAVVWQPWNSGDSLPTTAGYWYLTRDVKLNSRFAEIKTAEVYVCLNGFTVTAKEKGADGLGTNIWRFTSAGKLTVCDCTAKTVDGVYSAGKLTGTSMGAVYTMNNAGALINIYDGIISGNKADGTNSGAAVVIQSKSRLNVYGGLFTDNEAGKSGGAIYNNGTTYIHGGTFTGNTAATEGGAVYNVGELYILGGKFTGNTATTGAVFTSGNTLGISGNPEITGNNGGNLYLATGKVITLGTMDQGEAKIGISVAANTLPRFVSNEMGDKDCSGYFFSDLANVGLTVKENKLYMGMTTDHKHCDCFGIGGEYCDHTSRDWFKWTDPTSLPTSGSWCLDTDVTVADVNGVTVTGDLWLCLNGHTIDGDGHVVMKIRNAEHDVLISDCQNEGEITNGSALNYGAIYLEKGTFTMFGGKLTDNHCTQTASGGWAGGAIQARGDVKLVGVILENNISDTEGGAICMREAAKATLVNCTFKNNKAYTGGAIYTADGRNEILVKNCIFEGNTATTDGGAMVVKSKLTVEGDCVFEKNTADNCAGAVLVMSGGHFQMNGGKFLKNEAPKNNGGAIYISTGCSMTMDGGEIVENSAKTSGGGIYLLNSTFTMNGGKVNENSVQYYGGGIAGEGAVMNLNGGEISGNKADQQGGGLYAKYRVQGEKQTVTEININGVKIAKNESAQGGAIATIRYTKINMSAGSIEENYATKDAGAILLQTWSEMNITGGQITKNKADKACGGIYVSSESKMTMSGGSISYNTAKTNGGGVCLSNLTSLTMTGGDITGNEAQSHGGGIYNVAGTVELKGGKIQKNYAKTQGGGIFALYKEADGVTYKAVINIRSGSISGNKSADGAGIATIRYTTVNMSGGSVTGNIASKSGGGMLLQTGSKLRLSGGSVTGNTAQKDSAGGIFLSSECSMTMTGGIVSNNTCKGYGGGIYLMYANGSFTGGKIQGNKSTGYEAGGMYVRGSKVTLDGTDILENYAKKSGGGLVTVRYVAESKGIDAQPELVIKSGRIANNHSDGVGGGMLLQSQAETKMLGGSIEDNYCKSYGGGVYVSLNHTFTVTGGKITKNVSDGWGGGIYHLRASTGNYQDFELSYNKAASLGGGMIINGTEAQPSAVQMKNVKVIGNEAREGGGVRTQDRFQTFRADKCIFKDNKATGFAGGLMIFFGLKDVKVTGCLFENNSAGTQGAGIYAMSALVDCEVSGCTFKGNTAGTEGGGLWTQGGFLLKDCVFDGNHAQQAGGAIATDVFANTRVRHPVLYIEDCVISNNTSGTNGGGIYADTASYVHVSDTEILNNTSKLEGGAMWIVDDTKLHNITITGNRSGGEGYALYYHASEFDGLSYIRGAHSIGGEMIVKDNEGGDMYMGNQTGIAVSDKGLTGNTYMNIRLYGGYLTQLLRGAYNYEGGDTVYTVTAGNRSLTEPEVFATGNAVSGEETEAEAEGVKIAPVVFIGGGALIVAIIAIVVLILLVGRKKKTGAKK